MTLIVKCVTCGKKMKAPVALAGKRVRCKCGDRLQVPFPNEPVVPELFKGSREPLEAGPVPADLTDLAALADGEGLGQKRSCPECFANMPDDGVLCTACGYDSRTGRKFQSATDAAETAAATEKSKASKKAKKEPLAKFGDDKPGKFAFLGQLVKPLLILTVIALLLGAAWYIKGAVFFNPREQLKEDHMKITTGMTVKQVVANLGKKPSSVETVRPDSQSKSLLEKLTPRKLQYKDNFVKQYSKEDLAFGFTFIYVYSQRDELHIYFTPNGRVEAAEKHDPLARLGL